MITKKSILALIIFMLLLVSIHFVAPLTEQYQGATGYIYQYGAWYHLLYVIILIGAIFCIIYILAMYEVRN